MDFVIMLQNWWSPTGKTGSAAPLLEAEQKTGLTFSNFFVDKHLDPYREPSSLAAFDELIQFPFMFMFFSISCEEPLTQIHTFCADNYS